MSGAAGARNGTGWRCRGGVSEVRSLAARGLLLPSSHATFTQRAAHQLRHPRVTRPAHMGPRSGTAPRTVPGRPPARPRAASTRPRQRRRAARGPHRCSWEGRTRWWVGGERGCEVGRVARACVALWARGLRARQRGRRAPRGGGGRPRFATIAHRLSTTLVTSSAAGSGSRSCVCAIASAACVAARGAKRAAPSAWRQARGVPSWPGRARAALGGEAGARGRAAAASGPSRRARGQTGRAARDGERTDLVSRGLCGGAGASQGARSGAGTAGKTDAGAGPRAGDIRAGVTAGVGVAPPPGSPPAARPCHARPTPA
jgi:hypothetical protein